MNDSRFSQIEQTQQELRTCIEASKALAEKSEQLLARHRRPAEPESGTPKSRSA